MTILEQLGQRDQFTDIEEFIAEYILAHREEIYGCFHYILNSIYGLIFRKDFYRNMDLKAQHDNVVRRLQRWHTDE